MLGSSFDGGGPMQIDWSRSGRAASSRPRWSGRDGLHAQLARRADDPQRDLSAVGDEDAVKH